MLIWISVAWRMFLSRIFWPFSFLWTLHFSCLRVLLSFAMGPQWTLGLDLYGNPVMTTAMEKFYHFGVTAARFYTPSLLFSRDPLLGTYSTILRFFFTGGFLMVYD